MPFTIDTVECADGDFARLQPGASDEILDRSQNENLAVLRKAANVVSKTDCEASEAGIAYIEFAQIYRMLKMSEVIRSA